MAVGVLKDTVGSNKATIARRVSRGDSWLAPTVADTDVLRLRSHLRSKTRDEFLRPC
jgi:hypothetical protein